MGRTGVEKVDSIMFSEFVDLCRKLEATSSRREKITLIANFLRSLPRGDIAIATRFLAGKVFPEYLNLKLDLGWSTISRVLRKYGSQNVLFEFDKPTLRDVYSCLYRISRVSGEDSRRRKEQLFQGLILRLSPIEVEFLLRIIFGETRIGACEGVILEAIAEASGVTLEEVRRAYMFMADIGDVACRALVGGKRLIESTSLRLFHPVKPMLAEMAYSVEEALKAHHFRSALEYKYDGVRVQIHVSSHKIRIYTRRLTNITESTMDIAERVKNSLRASSAVIDGEIIGVVNGKPVPFQDLSRRVRRQKDLLKFLKTIPLKLYAFDMLYLDGTVLTDKPYSYRRELLEKVLSEDMLATRIVPSSLEEAERFYQEAIKLGHEGIMVKCLDSTYEPGHRGKKWFKVKTSDTIDCVIIAAEWGHGRRSGWLSDYLLAVLDEETGEFVPVGKTFKGLTDEEFQEMTKRLLELKIGEEGHVVYVKPRIVVEVAYSEIQRSPRYSSGYALRFARITRIRWDKSPYDITTLSELKRRYRREVAKKSLPEKILSEE